MPTIQRKPIFMTFCVAILSLVTCLNPAAISVEPLAAQEDITITELPTLGGEWNGAEDINDLGQVVGHSKTETGETHPFIWSAEMGMVDIGILDLPCWPSGIPYSAPFSKALHVNASGQVVGNSVSTYLTTGGYCAWASSKLGYTHAFSWTSDGGLVDLWADLGNPCSDGMDGRMCFQYSGSKVGNVSDAGHVVGTNVDYDGNLTDFWAKRHRAFIWTEQEGMTRLPTLPGDAYWECEAIDVNSLGMVAGSCGASTHPLFGPTEHHTVVWMPDGRVIDLGDLQIVAVNDLGQVALHSSGNSSVIDLAADGSGNLYAGGQFTTAGGVGANDIAKWDGSSWGPLGGGMGGYSPSVSAVYVDGDGDLYAGGSFSTAGGVSASGIAKWDGTSWSALGTELSGAVRALATDGNGNLYAGGYLYISGDRGANIVAKWDGTSWSALGGEFNNWVSALTTDGNGNLYAGGGFYTAGGVSAYHIAKWDGTSWSALGAGMNGIMVGALATDGNGNLYAGGSFSTAGGVSANNIAKWDGASWSPLGGGIEGSSPCVYALLVDGGGDVYAGGRFATAGGSHADRVARWDGSSWSPIGGGIADNRGEVHALTLDATGVLYAGGSFRSGMGPGMNRVAKWDGVQWLSLGTGIADTTYLWSEADGLRDLGTLAGDSKPRALNNLGEITGTSYAGDATRFSFLWSPDGGMIDLGDLGWEGYATPWDLSEMSQVVGESASADGYDRAFSWLADPGITELPLPSGHDSSCAWGVNNLGQVIGRSWSEGYHDESTIVWTVPLPPTTPEGAIAAAADEVAVLLAAEILGQGEVNALISKLESAQAQIDKGNSTAATNVLSAFINQVDALVNSGRLTDEEAQPLIDAANLAISLIEG